MKEKLNGCDGTFTCEVEKCGHQRIGFFDGETIVDDSSSPDCILNNNLNTKQNELSDPPIVLNAKRKIEYYNKQVNNIPSIRLNIEKK